jgi:hypothetical protein
MLLLIRDKDVSAKVAELRGEVGDGNALCAFDTLECCYFFNTWLKGIADNPLLLASASDAIPLLKTLGIETILSDFAAQMLESKDLSERQEIIRLATRAIVGSEHVDSALDEIKNSKEWTFDQIIAEMHQFGEGFKTEYEQGTNVPLDDLKQFEAKVQLTGKHLSLQEHIAALSQQDQRRETRSMSELAAALESSDTSTSQRPLNELIAAYQASAGPKINPNIGNLLNDIALADTIDEAANLAKRALIAEQLRAEIAKQGEKDAEAAA